MSSVPVSTTQKANCIEYFAAASDKLCMHVFMHCLLTYVHCLSHDAESLYLVVLLIASSFACIVCMHCLLLTHVFRLSC